MTVMIPLLVALILLGCLMDSLSMILLVIPFLWPVLVEINGGLYMTAEGAGFAMSTEDLKIWFGRSEEHTSELQSLMRISYAVFCLKKKNKNDKHNIIRN